MTKKKVLIVFFVHGGLIGVVGIIAGVALGVMLAANIDVIVAALEQIFHFKILSPEVYYISEIPSRLESRDVFIAALVAGGLCLCAPLYPALVASRIEPARALRYD
jgi:lipoprotein-releasing system permease protein